MITIISVSIISDNLQWVCYIHMINNSSTIMCRLVNHLFKTPRLKCCVAVCFFSHQYVLIEVTKNTHWYGTTELSNYLHQFVSKFTYMWWWWSVHWHNNHVKRFTYFYSKQLIHCFNSKLMWTEIIVNNQSNTPTMWVSVLEKYHHVGIQSKLMMKAVYQLSPI